MAGGLGGGNRWLRRGGPGAGLAMLAVLGALVSVTGPGARPAPARAADGLAGVRVAGVQVDRRPAAEVPPPTAPDIPPPTASPDAEPDAQPPPPPPPPSDAEASPAPGLSPDPGNERAVEDPDSACPGPTGGPFVAQHNSLRCQRGLAPLTLDPAVSAHAQFHAERLMAGHQCESLWHSPELADWYSPAYWGENASCVQWNSGCWGDFGFVMTGWLASASHAANVFDPQFRFIGVGIACDGTHAYFVTHFRS